MQCSDVNPKYMHKTMLYATKTSMVAELLTFRADSWWPSTCKMLLAIAEQLQSC